MGRLLFLRDYLEVLLVLLEGELEETAMMRKICCSVVLPVAVAEEARALEAAEETEDIPGREAAEAAQELMVEEIRPEPAVKAPTGLLL